MVKYLGPKFKIIRRFKLPFMTGFCSKSPLKQSPPGENKNLMLKKKYSEFKQYIDNKKKVQYVYGIINSKLKKYFKLVKENPNNPMNLTVLLLIESRLDITLFKAGFSKTIRQARQWITHGHFLVNSHIILYVSFKVSKGDVIQCSKLNTSVIKDIKYNLYKRYIEKTEIPTKQVFCLFYKICFLNLSFKIIKNLGPRELIIK